MLKQVADNLNATRFADAALAASRQVWLAGLGAAIVTREWARSDAGQVFRTLVKEGTAVESRAIRIVGDQVESSVTKANVVLKRTRTAIGNVVRVYTDTAAGIVQSLPKFLPDAVKAPAQRHAKLARKSTTKAARNVGKRVKRATKATSKR